MISPPFETAHQPGDDQYAEPLPPGLPADQLRELAQMDGVRATSAILFEWTTIGGAIALCHCVWNPFLYGMTVMFIGARQHALAVLQHDAAHYRLFPHKRWNNWVAEVLLAWPILLSNQRFRDYHFLHHRYTGTPKDGNRAQYGTHTPEGDLTPVWTFPKRKLQLIGWVLFRVSGLVGVIYFMRSARRLLTYGSFTYRGLNLLYYAAALGLIFTLRGGRLFLLYWIVPLGTWFIMTNLLRIAGEHSAIEPSGSVYQFTRTTLPSWFDRIFIVPHNISYHLEHHLYPHIPFYRLPELHSRLMQQDSYRQQAHVAASYGSVLQALAGRPRSDAQAQQEGSVNAK